MDTFETTVYTSVLITCFVLGAVFIFAAITIYRNQRRHYLVQRSHFLAEIELLEQERTRIARDLHDELGPRLAVVRFQIQASQQDGTDSDALLKKACGNIDYITERMGGIARNLTPRLLFDRGLSAALADFFDQYSVVRQLAIEFHYDVLSAVPASCSLHIYRMLQELVYNTVKYADATRAIVYIKERRRKLYVYYKDNGKGFSKNDVRVSTGGLGLSSIQNRALMLGGKMHYQAANGTEYFFEIPLLNSNGQTFTPHHS